MKSPYYEYLDKNKGKDLIMIFYKFKKDFNLETKEALRIINKWKHKEEL